MGNQLDIRLHALTACALAVAMSCLGAKAAAARPDLPRRESHIKSSDGVTLRVVRLGRATARPPVILVPGWTMGLEAFAPIADRLAVDREVWLYDSRSQGGSSLSLSANTPEDRARDLRTLVDALGPGRPLVIAWSQGVQDLSAYVLADGDRKLAGVVLVDALPSGGAGDLAADPQRAKVMLQRLELYRRAPLDYELGMLSAIVTRPDAAAVRQSLARIALATPASIGADMLVSDLYGADRGAVAFSRPTLVVAAGANPAPSELKAWAERRHAGFGVVEGAGHAVFIDQPDGFLRQVRAWEAAQVR